VEDRELLEGASETPARILLEVGQSAVSYAALLGFTRWKCTTLARHNSPSEFPDDDEDDEDKDDDEEDESDSDFDYIPEYLWLPRLTAMSLRWGRV
jgi:hypothetical protein